MMPQLEVLAQQPLSELVDSAVSWNTAICRHGEFLFQDCEQVPAVENTVLYMKSMCKESTFEQCQVCKSIQYPFFYFTSSLQQRYKTNTNQHLFIQLLLYLFTFTINKYCTVENATNIITLIIVILSKMHRIQTQEYVDWR